MALSTQMKKEAAELRKIAKQSRLSQKEAAARERKQKLKRKQQQQEGEQKKEEATSSAGSKSARRKGAIVLPSEVQEMQQRLFNAGTPQAEGPNANNNNNSNSNNKSNNNATGGKTAKGVKRQRTVSASSLSTPASLRPHVEQPPYRLEVHHKNKQILLDVTLHHIPAAHVDVSETTDTMFVVDTSRHTKKYRLELPIPEGMCIDAEQATCELHCDMGVLKCVLPIKGDIPTSLQEERAKMLETIQKQKSLRFRIGVDGELKVRSRRSLLAKNEREQAALRAAATAGEKERAEGEIAQDDQENKKKKKPDGKKGNNVPAHTTNSTTTATATDTSSSNNNNNNNGKLDTPDGVQGGGPNAPNTKSKTEKTKRQKRDAEQHDVSDRTQSLKSARKGTPPTPRAEEAAVGNSQGNTSRTPQQQQQQPNKQKKAPSKMYEEEHKRAMAIAKSTGKAAQSTLRERIAQAKILQKKMQERLAVRSVRRDVRSEKKQDSFLRVLEEQKRQLLARAELNASIAEAEKKTAARRSTGKTVTFVAAEE